jgi:hypothetical protein
MRIQMNARALRTMCFASCLLLAPAMHVYSQAAPPPPPVGGPMGPGAPPGPGRHADSGSPGGPDGASRPNGAASGSQSGNRAMPARNALQFGPVGRWWDDRSVVQRVGLSRDQQRRMDSIFKTSKPEILANYNTFLKAQSNLQTVNKDPSADKARVFAAIDAVNEARTALQKTTSGMLLQIRKQMSTEQIEKLQDMP